MNISDIPKMLRREGIVPLSMDRWKYDYEPDDFISIREALRMKGLSGEKRDWRLHPTIGAMFGNYTMEEWYSFVKDIAENGLKNPIFLDKDEYGDYKISEGNHRVQALKQLGYDKVPVEYAKR